MLPVRAETVPPSARSAAAPAAVPPRPLPTENGVETHTCFDVVCQRIFGTVRRNPHVIPVPQATEDELAAMQARDSRWVARCRPQIRQDRYGMPRYIYAAPDCEYGRLD